MTAAWGPLETQGRKACWGCADVFIPYNTGFCPACWSRIPPDWQLALMARQPGQPEFVAIVSRLQGTRPLMSSPRPRYVLSNVDIMALRTSRHSRVPDVGAPAGVSARYNASDDTFELVRGGNVLTAHPSLDVVGALLRAERFEPGWIESVALNSALTPDESLLDADDRRRRALAQSDAQARARFATRIAAEAASRRPVALSDAPEDLSIEDLFDTL